MVTTFRATSRAALKGILDAYLAANPTLLVTTYDHRPESFNLTPCAFVDMLPESVRHDAGVRDRTMQPVVVIVDRVSSNDETMDRLDVLVDGLLDQFSATNPFVTGGNWRGGLSIADSYEQIGDSFFAAVTFTFADVFMSEGRS